MSTQMVSPSTQAATRASKRADRGTSFEREEPMRSTRGGRWSRMTLDRKGKRREPGEKQGPHPTKG
jgi:hypothetical protein